MENEVRVVVMYVCDYMTVAVSVEGLESDTDETFISVATALVQEQYELDVIKLSNEIHVVKEDN